MKKEIDEDEYVQRLRIPKNLLNDFHSESNSLAQLSNSCPGSPIGIIKTPACMTASYEQNSNLEITQSV